MDMKDLKKKYGVTMAPVEATRCFKRKMRFDHTKVKTESFILINDNATQLPNGKPCNGSKTHINTYDGAAGPGHDSNQCTWALGDAKKLRKALRDYEECPVEDCPLAVRVVAKAPVAPVAAPEPEEVKEEGEAVEEEVQ